MVTMVKIWLIFIRAFIDISADQVNAIAHFWKCATGIIRSNWNKNKKSGILFLTFPFRFSTLSLKTQTELTLVKSCSQNYWKSQQLFSSNFPHFWSTLTHNASIHSCVQQLHSNVSLYFSNEKRLRLRWYLCEPQLRTPLIFNAQNSYCSTVL